MTLRINLDPNIDDSIHTPHFLSSYEWLIPHRYLLLTNDVVKNILQTFSVFRRSIIIALPTFTKYSDL